MTIKFNLNDEVTSKIRTNCLSKFIGNPLIKMCFGDDGDGFCTAKAPFHAFMYVFGPDMVMGRDIPISTNVALEQQ